MNFFLGIGNLTDNLTLGETANGIEYTRFTIAVKRGFGDDVDFIKCVAWKTSAQLMNKYCKKGDKIAVRGELNVRRYEDRHGENRTATEINVISVEFLSPKKNSDNSTKKNLEPIQEDLPF